MTRTVSGARVLITGAAVGMGRLYAERAVAEGAKAVILWDRDPAALAATAAALSERANGRTRVSPYVVDIGDLGAIAQAAQRVRTEVGDPDIVVNNAGIVRDAFFWDHDNGDDTRRTMQINALAPMYITREFLPAMIGNVGRESRIVNIAAAAGMRSSPRKSVYAASKAAMIEWSESLRRELVQQGHGQVKVTTACPGKTTAGLFEEQGSRLTRVLTPERIVDRVWRAMLAGKPMLLMPWTVAVSSAIHGLGAPLRR